MYSGGKEWVIRVNTKVLDDHLIPIDLDGYKPILIVLEWGILLREEPCADLTSSTTNNLMIAHFLLLNVLQIMIMTTKVCIHIIPID